MSKIDLINEIIQATTPRPSTRAARNSGRAAAGGRSDRAAAPAEGSSVKLSAAARQLLSGNGPPVDARRVDAISSAISNGSYQVDSATVARDIAANVRTALGRGHKS